MPSDVFEAAFEAACNTKVVRFERSLRAFKRHHPEADLSEFTLERVFHTTNVAAINALSEEAYQDALAKGKAAAGLKPDDRAAQVAKAQAKRKEKLHAEKEANNGTNPKFPGDPSCPDAFAAFKTDFQRKFEAHLKKCPSCRNWAWQVSQLTAAPVGAFPKTLSVVKCAAKVQEKGAKFPGRIVVESYKAAAKAAKPQKRRGAKGAAPPAKKAKK